MDLSRAILSLSFLFLLGCGGSSVAPQDRLGADTANYDDRVRPEIYAKVKLTSDLTSLTPRERIMLPVLLQAAAIMDSLFWLQAWGPKDSLPHPTTDPETRSFFAYNYGPWDRMADDLPFMDRVGAKPLGARFYPHDITLNEFEAWEHPAKNDPYSMVVRNADGGLHAVPYHQYFAAQVGRAADLLEAAAAMAEEPGTARYLKARAQALRNDRYNESDRAWLDMRNNRLDVIIGPIEHYEDRFLGMRTAYSSYIAIKDMAWSEKLDRFAQLLPGLQRDLPCDPRYKRESPGTDAQLGAYDVVYYAGDCNAGGKTIAVNLPNDEALQLQKGTRRLQFKNVMQAKFERILNPIGRILIAEDQRRHITFEAFFQDVMFHEVAHGLGIKHTVNGKGSVREALLDEHGAWEEGKADILGLWMVKRLRDQGEITTGSMLDDHVTFLAGIFRSVRFGAGSAHGKANMFRFNYLMEQGAYARDPNNGTYRVVPERADSAMADLCALILRIQGEGALDELRELMERYGNIGPELQGDLTRLGESGIPVDIVFQQGASVLGLRPTP